MNIHLNKEIEMLKTKIVKLCSIVEDAMRLSIIAVNEKNSVVARQIIDRDVATDELEIEIEEECLKILALHQPVAGDLRYVITCLKVNNDLERVGDLCGNIAGRAIALAEYEERNVLEAVDLRRMLSCVRDMVTRAIDSLINLDAELAHQVIKDDDIVDNMNSDMYGIVTKLIQDDPQYAAFYINLLSVSRGLERIADSATNVCEDVIYMVTGKIVRHHI